MPQDDIDARLARVEANQAALANALKGGVAAISAKLDGIDGRLQQVESRSTSVGALAGGVMSVGVALIVSRLKTGA